MRHIYRNICSKNKGFTLVELVVVISVLGLLTGIAFPSYRLITDQSKERGTRTNMSGIADALEVYSNYNDIYPSTIEGLPKLEEVELLRNESGTDLWGNNLIYISNTLSYTLTSNGKDRQSGTDDDIVLEGGILVAEADGGDGDGDAEENPVEKEDITDISIVKSKSKSKFKTVVR